MRLPVILSEVCSVSGLFFFRLEDTDKKREVEGGADDILKGMNDFGLTIDEGFVAPGVISGDYGPYQQSQRAEIYHAYVKTLVEQNLAYPCFCSEETRQAAREQQEAAKDRTGYYGDGHGWLVSSGCTSCSDYDHSDDCIGFR